MKIKTATYVDFSIACPEKSKSIILNRIKKAFRSFDKFMNEMDWVGMELQDKLPGEFTDDDWMLLADILDDILTGRLDDNSEQIEEQDAWNREMYG